MVSNEPAILRVIPPQAPAESPQPSSVIPPQVPAASLQPSSVMAAQASTMPQPTAAVQVVVPEGAAAGQQVAFSTPDGQQLRVTMPSSIAPGSTFQARYTPVQGQRRSMGPPAPPLPPASQTIHEMDRHGAQMSWIFYGLSWLVCCFCFPFAIFVPIAWVCIAACYFCKPAHQRKQLKQQRTAAIVALCSCLVIAFIAWTFFSGAIGFKYGMKMGRHTQEHVVVNPSLDQAAPVQTTHLRQRKDVPVERSIPIAKKRWEDFGVFGNNTFELFTPASQSRQRLESLRQGMPAMKRLSQKPEDWFVT